MAEIRVHGNVLTPDAEIRRLAGIEVGAVFTPDTVAEVTRRLEAAHRFESVEVLKRYASIADPTQVLLVVIVDEGRVKIEALDEAEADRPARVVRGGGLGLMFLPLLDFEDGYGFTYGAQFARPGVAGAHSRLSFPLTWGGDKRAAAQLEKTFDGSRGVFGTRGLLTRVETGVSIDQRTNPYFETDDTRDRVWFRGERTIGRSVTAGGTAAWQHVSFGGSTDQFAQYGLDIAVRHAARSDAGAQRGLRARVGGTPRLQRPPRPSTGPISKRAATSACRARASWCSAPSGRTRTCRCRPI